MTNKIYLAAFAPFILINCATWQDTARSVATVASATAKTAEESSKDVLTALCVEDTKACHVRKSCIEMKKTGGDDLLSCCPEYQTCIDRSKKVQDAIVAVHKSVKYLLDAIPAIEVLQGMLKKK